MFNRADVVYLYDGSYEGILCAVFESYERKELPSEIQPQDAAQLYLYPCIKIATDINKADRVKRGIIKKSREAYDMVELCYYSCHPHKERLILDYIRLVMLRGKDVFSMLTDDTVIEFQSTVKKLTNEAHQYRQFVRFSEIGGVLTSVIDPNNYVLPLIAQHFSDRYKNEAFLIYDERHGQVLFYQKGKSIIVPVDQFELAEAAEEDKMYQSLWKTFYDTIAIKERYNPRCRMGHMQKRYWKHLTEMDPKVESRAGRLGDNAESCTLRIGSQMLPQETGGDFLADK